MTTKCDTSQRAPGMEGSGSALPADPRDATPKRLFADDSCAGRAIHCRNRRNISRLLEEPRYGRDD